MATFNQQGQKVNNQININNDLYSLQLHPTNCLYKISDEVDISEGKSLDNILVPMFKTLEAKNGIGIAAPQMGFNKRIFLIRYKSTRVCLINPVIIKKWGGLKKSEEGCLSCPGILKKILRYNCIKIKYYDERYELKTTTFTRRLAFIAQHEMDHLNGITLMNR